ncbi:Membrane-spanning 4-domains subfamily A member 13 [Vulpes lagopus]
MIGIFHVFMWYFLLILYMGQIRGVFGTYEPITYKTGCSLWGIIGVSIIRATRHPTQGMITCALTTNIFCIIIAIIASVLTTIELSSFNSVSYRNYGQATLYDEGTISGRNPNMQNRNLEDNERMREDATVPQNGLCVMSDGLI